MPASPSATDNSVTSNADATALAIINATMNQITGLTSEDREIALAQLREGLAGLSGLSPQNLEIFVAAKVAEVRKASRAAKRAAEKAANGPTVNAPHILLGTIRDSLGTAAVRYTTVDDDGNVHVDGLALRAYVQQLRATIDGAIDGPQQQQAATFRSFTYMIARLVPEVPSQG